MLRTLRESKKITVMVPTRADILLLSVPERIELIELIWETMPEDYVDETIDPEHLRIVEERLAAHERDPSRAIPWEVAWRQLRERR